MMSALLSMQSGQGGPAAGIAQDVIAKFDTNGDGQVSQSEFEQAIGSRGRIEGDEELIGDGVALMGAAKFPARVKCVLMPWKAYQAALANACATANQVMPAFGTNRTALVSLTAWSPDPGMWRTPCRPRMLASALRRDMSRTSA